MKYNEQIDRVLEIVRGSNILIKDLALQIDQIPKPGSIQEENKAYTKRRIAILDEIIKRVKENMPNDERVEMESLIEAVTTETNLLSEDERLNVIIYAIDYSFGDYQLRLFNDLLMSNKSLLSRIRSIN